MPRLRMLLPFLVFFVLVFVPSLAAGQESSPLVDVPGETVIVPDVPPPAGTNWPALVVIGTGYVFLVMELLKAKLGVKGWKVLALVPVVAAGVSVYQVGISDPLLIAKHGALLVLSAVGGVAGVKRLIEWVRRALVAHKAGEPIPDPPSIGPAPSVPPTVST